MPISSQLEPMGRFYDETWTGAITAPDVAAYWRRFLVEPAARALHRTLADLRAADPRFTGQELFRLVQEVAVPLVKGCSWRTAILVGGPVQFGISRQYQAVAGVFSRDAIFTSRDEAVAWLVGEAPAPEP